MKSAVRHRGRGRRLGLAGLAVAATLVAAPPIAAGENQVADVAVKAAFLYNFAKFTDWPGLPAGPIIICVVGDPEIADALVKTVLGHEINGHAVEVRRPQDATTWRLCQLLYIAAGEIQRSTAGLSAIKPLPVLTASDGKGFAQGSGIIELYVEDGRFRFAINVGAAERSGLRISSRLLGLAKVIRG